MFRRLVFKSLSQTKSRLAVMALALALAALLVTSLLTLSWALRGKAQRELRAYGANLLLLPRTDRLVAGVGNLDFGAGAEDSFLRQESLAPLEELKATGQVLAYVPRLYLVGRIRGEPIAVAGANFASLVALNPGWRWQGSLPEKPDQAALGAVAANKLGLSIGDSLWLEFRGQQREFRVAGVVDSGASEDNQLLVSLAVTQDLLERPGAVAMVEVSALGNEPYLESLARDLEEEIPNSRAQPVAQMARAETRVLSRVEFLMAAVTTLVLAASAVAVFSTMTALVLERLPEVGLMKALGASGGRVALLLLSAAWLISAGAAVVGYVLGSLLANVVGMTVFGSTVPPQPLALPVTLAAVLALTTGAGLPPVRRAATVEPITILRGE